MKYLKYVLGGIALLFVIFLLFGIFKPEINYDSEIVVDKPLAEAWVVSQDEDKLKDWLVGFQKIEHISGTPGEVGAISDVYFTEPNGQESVIREEITKLVPEESVSMYFTSDFMDMDYSMDFESMGDKTKILTSTTAKGNGMISRSIMALIGGAIKDQEDSNLVLLKKVIEENTKDYNPAPEPMPEVENEVSQ